MNISKHKNIILIIIALLLVFFGYWFLFLSKREVSNNPLSQSGLVNQSAPIAGTPYDKEFVTSLLGLSSVDLDVSVFESNAYKSLNYPEVPFTVNYFRESGRDNPFLPIGVDANTVQSNVKTQVEVSTIEETPEGDTQNISTTTPSIPGNTTAPKPKPKSF